MLTASLNDIPHAIQLALAPVFLLTGIAGLLNIMTGRLARIIDRARVLEARVAHAAESDPAVAPAYDELRRLRQRGWLVNGCIALLTFCAMLIGLTIVMLFLGETAQLNILRLATISFLAGVSCFLLALLCFLTETLLATRILKFGRPNVPL